MHVRAVSFDCFETLLHTNWDPVAFGVQWLAARLECVNLFQAKQELERLLADSRAEYVRLHRFGDSEALDAFWISLYTRWAATLGLSAEEASLRSELWENLYGATARCFHAYEDVEPCLRALRDRGIRLIVLSNWDYTLEQTLTARGLRKWFEAVFASLLEGVEKPDPRLFRLAEERLGLQPHEMLHVGDHPIDDYEGALRAGWHALLLDRHCARPTDHQVVSSLLEVPQRLLDL